VRAGYSSKANGRIINAGTARDISINELALLISGNKDMIMHIPHIHPQSEIQKLKCDFSRAEKLLGWKPVVSIEEGIERTREWIQTNMI